MRRIITDRVVGRSGMSCALCLFAVLHFPGCGRFSFEDNRGNLDATVENHGDAGVTVRNDGGDAAHRPSGDAGNRDGAVGGGMSDAAADVDAVDAAPPIVEDASSGDGIARCRLDPNCGTGGVGATCSANNDCSVGECCPDAVNCGGGMCALSCVVEGDCPSDMHCAHGYCFFICESAADCATGMGCFHMSPPYVCEWG